MATEITFRRGSNDPTSGSGITLAEPVFNTNLHTFHIGLGYGITAEWVGAPISGLSADIAAGITYKIPTLAAVKNYVTGTSITNYVSSFNGLTGAVTGVTVGGTNVFTELNSFNAGICASGITLSSGIINAPSVGLYLTSSNTKNAKVNLLGGPSSSQIELDAITVRVRNTTDGALPTLELYEASDVYSAKIQYASSATNDATITFPAFTGTVALTNHVVTSFNGLTGSVTGVTVGGANTFTALNTFNAGISTSTITVSGGSTFTGNISAPNIVNSVVAGTGISVSGTTGSVTITNTGVQSFNGRTGAVTGASLGANTFTGLQTMTSGISAAGGMTLAGTLNTTGDIKFNGTAGKTIRTTQAPLSISGITSGVALGSSNAVVFGVQTTDPLKLYSATGVVEINQDNLINPFTTSIKLFTLDGSETNASVNIAPITYFSADRTLNIQDASGTIALTSQLMGAINGSTAATTAVTSFNGRTGAVQGVSAASAGDGIAVSGATGAVTITNTGVTRAVAGTGISVSGATGSVTITNIGVQSFNGNTGAVTGASLGANTFTGLNTFSAGITTAYIYASNGSTFGGTLKVLAGATFDGRVDVGGVLDVVSGVTLESTLDVGGVSRFTGTATFSGTVNGATATFNRLLTASGGISASGGMTLDGGTVWHSLNDGATSGLDAGLVHGVCGARFLENLQTGLLYGGLISVNAGNTAQVDISAGAGIVVTPGASLTAYPIPVVTPVTWATKTGVTLSGLTSSDETWLAIDSSGNLVQSANSFTDAQYQSQIPLGAALHLSRTYIQLVKTYPHVSYAQPEQFDPFIRAFGNLKLSGHEVSANGANLQVNRSAGKAYALGRNYRNDPNNPNIVTDTSAIPVTYIYHFYRNGSGAFTTTIDGAIIPGSLDNGTGTLGTVTPAKFSIQRIFYLPDQPTLLGVYYGRQEYNSIVDAQANIPFEEFSESESTATQGIFCGWLIVRGNATALNDTATAKFVNAGLFRNTSNIGGGGLAIASIDDLNDVTTTTPSNNQVLRWNSGTAQWVNSDVSSLAVSSFNGLTGAVTGVSPTTTNTFTALQSFTAGISASGGITFGSNISAPNIVNSFNGLTGAVTGVTVGGANTFTALNTFNAGISASALTVSGGATFSGNVYLGDAATGVTTDSNDKVNILAGGVYKSGIYRSYKTLAASTSGVVCTTPSDNSINTVNTFEVTLEYYQTGYVPAVAVHKFWIVVSYSGGGTISDFDYTESIVKGASTTLVPFTLSTHSSGYSLNITAAAPANTGKYSGWAFLTTVRVY